MPSDTDKPVICTYSLNRQPLSALICNGTSYPAFSGLLADRNDPAKASDAFEGPIPPGTYYIVDYPKGGRLQWLEDAYKDLRSLSHRASWFGLFSTQTGTDYMVVGGVQRGNFRLHPNGLWGISEGCITLMELDQFKKLAAYLRSQKPATIPTTDTKYYALVVVK